MALLKRYPTAVDRASNKGAAQVLGAPGAIIACACLTDSIDRRLSAEFWDGVFTGAELRRDDPRLVARNELPKHRAKGSNAQTSMYVVMDLWKRFVDGETIDRFIRRPKVVKFAKKNGKWLEPDCVTEAKHAEDMKW